MNIKWDAKKYTDDFSFVHEYGNDLIKLLTLGESKTILDLGCGNGALTQTLYDLGMDVIGMDSSAELLKVAKENHPKLKFMQADATNFKLNEKVNAVFSNAVFHWIEQDKQKQMLECVYEALQENGQFVFEFGGHGNNALIHEGLKEEFNRQGLQYQRPFYFPTIGAYTSLLEEVGFKVQYAILFNRMTELKGENGLADWIKMFVKTPFEMMNDLQKISIIHNTVEDLKHKLYAKGIWHADYVRIRCKAMK